MSAARSSRDDPAPPPWRYVAGCGRSFERSQRTERGAARDSYAYTDLAFPECPTCPHRVEPDDGPAFCVWRREDLARPFAGLEGWLDGDSS